MQKIMFVEDEISNNIPRIKLLFEKYLSDVEKDGLENASNDPMGATGEDLLDIFSKNSILEIYDSFKHALTYIESLSKEQVENYAMFIFDRNLSKTKYTVEEITKITGGFNKEIYGECEGDYLAYRLQLKGCPIADKVFFYSAYCSRKIPTDIQTMIENGTFCQTNYFDKNCAAELKKLIDNQEMLSLYVKFNDIFRFINNEKLGIEDEVMNILLEIQKSDAKLLTGNWRTGIEKCLKHMQKTKGLWHQLPNKKDGLGDQIQKLDRGNEANNIPGKTPAHIRDFFSTINHIINKYDAHKIYDSPRHYGVKALAYQLLEIIAWIGNNYK